jgi:hypothetical protein
MSDGPDIEKLRKAAALLPVKELLEKYRKIDRIVLHPKQREFTDLGASVSERALSSPAASRARARLARSSSCST